MGMASSIRRGGLQPQCVSGLPCMSPSHELAAPAAQAANETPQSSSSTSSGRLIHAMTWSGSGPELEHFSVDDRALWERADQLVRADQNFVQDIMRESDQTKADALFRHYFEKYFYQLSSAGTPSPVPLTDTQS